jgi:predicted HAD superfamily phosphohydrolase
LLLADPDIMGVLTRAEVERSFDLDEQFRHVDEIFARVFNSTTLSPEAAEIAEPADSLRAQRALR